MLIVALVLAVIGLAALVTAVVTSNALIAWVCIGASVVGVLLLIVDALRERSRDNGDGESVDGRDDETRDDATTVIPVTSESQVTEDYPDDDTGDAATTSVVSEPETSAIGTETSDEGDSESKRD